MLQVCLFFRFYFSSFSEKSYKFKQGRRERRGWWSILVFVVDKPEREKREFLPWKCAHFPFQPVESNSLSQFYRTALHYSLEFPQYSSSYSYNRPRYVVLSSSLNLIERLFFASILKNTITFTLILHTQKKTIRISNANVSVVFLYHVHRALGPYLARTWFLFLLPRAQPNSPLFSLSFSA